MAPPPELAGDVPTHPASKVVGWEALLDLQRRYRAEGRTVVWTNGCFDLLHVGHVRNLQAARQLGDVLVVGLNSDDSVTRLKGPERPLLPAAERAEILAALACVDHVVIFDELTPEAALARLKPDIHCKGSDYAPPHGKPIPEAKVVASYGGRIEFLPLLPDHSTTDLVRRIRDLAHRNPPAPGS
jgi:rfaE bifunctional protein nucleotidyltransferase chain/domain